MIGRTMVRPYNLLICSALLALCGSARGSPLGADALKSVPTALRINDLHRAGHGRGEAVGVGDALGNHAVAADYVGHGQGTHIVLHQHVGTVHG